MFLKMVADCTDRIIESRIVTYYLYTTEGLAIEYNPQCNLH